MAEALLAGQLPPACTPAAEQYALCVLAYLLLTGLHPIEAPAVREDLLRQIVDRPPLPFAARGVAAWPAAESVLRRGLAKQPVDRFPDVAALAGTFAAVSPKPAAPARQRHVALNAALEQTRRLAPSALPPLHRAWFALRAALTLEDAELLGAADILIGEAGPGWAARSVAVHIARARSDTRMEREAVETFLADVETLAVGEEAAEAVLAAAEALDGAAFRDASAAPLALWASRRVDRLTTAPRPDRKGEEALLVEAALALAKAGAVPCPPDLDARLETLASAGKGSVWLWALAHDVFARDPFRERALAAVRPRHPFAHAFSLLRLHQMGETRWVAAARRLLARETELAVDHAALLAIELQAPERAVFPSFLSASPWE